MPPQTKELVRRLAAREGTTASALVKQLLGTLLRTSILAELPPPAPDSIGRDTRLNLRLAAEDRLLLRERSAARGMPAATYASVLIRAHLRNIAPLPREELAVLKRSVAELSAIGRNLNQIARAVNQGEKPSGPRREDLVMMLKVASGLRDHIKALIKENERTWRNRATNSG